MDEPERAVRASDAEREQVSRQLGEHAAAGRLTPEELDERLDAAYAARTNAELDRLLEDLPAAPVARAEDPARKVARARLTHRAGAAGDRVAAVRGDLAGRRRQRVVLADLDHPRRRRRPCRARPGARSGPAPR